MPTIADILRARKRDSTFDRVASGASTTAPAPVPPGVFERLISEPLPMDGRLSILPAMVTPERGREWAVPGVLAGAWNAFTAPGRALQGQEVGEDEALNFAGSMMLGGMPAVPTGYGIAGTAARLPAERLKEVSDAAGELARTRGGTLLHQLRNTPGAVEARVANAQDFLKQSTEPWVPREYAFDRSLIRDALEGFPGQEQTTFQRLSPARKDLSYIDEIYTDPRNRGLIKQQIARGLPLGGETFYASMWPIYVEAMSRGIPREVIDQWIHRTTAASARNSIMNEQAGGNLLHGMAQRGIPLNEQTVAQEVAGFKQRYGTGLPIMPVHTQGVARQLHPGGDPRSRLTATPRLAADAPEYKIPTYALQRSGDFKNSWVGDVHEAAGETLGSARHPYFRDQGGFAKEEYGRAEGHMLDIAREMGLPGGTAQAGRWFGGGELTGLISPRGDALDLMEKQVAMTLHKQGKAVTPKSVRDYTLKLVTEGGDLLPWFKKSDLPEHRF